MKTYTLRASNDDQTLTAELTEDQLAQFCVDHTGGGMNTGQTARAMNMHRGLLEGEVVHIDGVDFDLDLVA